MLGPFSRTQLLLGSEGMEKLRNSKVAIFGVGGVGSFAAEALARSGVMNLVLVDDDNICLTNINRQIHATTKTVGKDKVEVMKNRILEINPRCNVEVHKAFYSKDTAEDLIKDDYDYVIDAIDTVSSKLDMAERCSNKGIKIISSMGAGNKLDPTRFEVTDIYKTSVCPLAKVMRYELKRRRVKKLKVVYSQETPIKPVDSQMNSCKSNCICPPGADRTCAAKRQIPGSISFVPSVVGLIIAGEVIKDLIK